MEILNLPMRQEYALQILNGDKVREYRDCSMHWCRRLGTLEKNSKTHKWDLKEIKHFDGVHFYPYNNKWFLDCTVESIRVLLVDEEFQMLYGDECGASLGSYVFVISIGDILATNLEK